MTRSTVAPISKVGSQGHSPLPYQAGRRDRKWRSCRIRARARIERELSLRVLATPPSSASLFPFHSFLSISEPRSLSHAHDAPTIRTTVHHSLTRVSSWHLLLPSWFFSLSRCWLLFSSAASVAALYDNVPVTASTPRGARRDANHCSERRIDLKLDYVCWFHQQKMGRSCYVLLFSHVASPWSRLIRTITFRQSPAVLDRPMSSRGSRGNCYSENRWQSRSVTWRWCTMTPVYRVDTRGRLWIPRWYASISVTDDCLTVSPILSVYSFSRGNHFEFLSSLSTCRYLVTENNDLREWYLLSRARQLLSRHLSLMICYAPRIIGRDFFFWIIEMTISAFISRVLFSLRSSHAIHSLESF